MAKIYSYQVTDHHWSELIISPRFWLCALLIVLLAVSIANAQSLEETIQQLSEDAAKAYVAPVVDGLGANLNTGWFRQSPPPTQVGFNISVGIVAMGAFVDEGRLRFSTEGSYNFQEDEARELASSIDGWDLLPAMVQDEIINAVINTEFRAVKIIVIENNLRNFTAIAALSDANPLANNLTKKGALI